MQYSPPPSSLPRRRVHPAVGTASGVCDEGAAATAYNTVSLTEEAHPPPKKGCSPSLVHLQCSHWGGLLAVDARCHGNPFRAWQVSNGSCGDNIRQCEQRPGRKRTMLQPSEGRRPQAPAGDTTRTQRGQHDGRLDAVVAFLLTCNPF